MVAGKKVVTGHVGRALQGPPNIQIVLRARLAGIDILVQKQLCSQVLASIFREDLDGNRPFAIDQLVQIHAMNPVARAGIKTVEAGIDELVRSLPTGQGAVGTQTGHEQDQRKDDRSGLHVWSPFSQV